MKKRPLAIMAFVFGVAGFWVQATVDPKTSISGAHLSGPTSWIADLVRIALVAFLWIAYLGPLIALILILFERRAGYLIWCAAVVSVALIGLLTLPSSPRLPMITFGISMAVQLVFLFLFQKAEA